MDAATKLIVEFPPYLRMPLRGSWDEARFAVEGHQLRRQKLASLGLRTSESFEASSAYWKAEKERR